MRCCLLGRRPPPSARVVSANAPALNAAYVGNAVSNTKYNLLTFVPKNLLEQFKLNMNRYFLFIACLQLISVITPVNPLTTWLPLIVIFAVTAIKEGLDDAARGRADALANARPYSVLRGAGGARELVPSRDIRVGDLVLLEADDEVPCDIVLLASADARGAVYTQTTNLDGESALKMRCALPATVAVFTAGKGGSGRRASGGGGAVAAAPSLAAAAAAFRGVVECAPPNDDLAKFDSQLRLAPGGAVLALSAAQLLLQATHVRSTEWALGLAVYTGNETKFGCNKRAPPTKYTLTDGFINGVSAAIFACQLAIVVSLGVAGNLWNEASALRAPYLAAESLRAPGAPFYMTLIIPARFLLLCSTLIPISLKLTLDLTKLSYAKFINADAHLRARPATAAEGGGGGGDAAQHHVGDTPAPPEGAVANSTALSEDLGQVRFVLTDKTGTLTENKMVLQVCTLLGVQYGRFDGGAGGAPQPATPRSTMPHALMQAAATGMMADMRLVEDAAQDARAEAAGSAGDAAGALAFLRALALCNDVVPGVRGADGLPAFRASSPDDEALVKAAAAYGVVLAQREGDAVVLELSCGGSGGGGGGGSSGEPPASRELYTQLACFDFSSDRKRMSVIVRSARTGALRLYCKGADDVVMARLAAGQDAARAAVQAQVDAYAAAGLRTLVFAWRDVSAEALAAFHAAHATASAAMAGRDEALERVYTALEQGLTLAAATAIEDKLQEGVPETVALLKAAGVAFWMLTGDKFSTALTIAATCNIRPAANMLVELSGDAPRDAAASLDAACARIARTGYHLAYEPLATGWSAALGALTLGCAGGRIVPREPHRPHAVLGLGLGLGAAAAPATSARSSAAAAQSAAAAAMWAPAAADSPYETRVLPADAARVSINPLQAESILLRLSGQSQQAAATAAHPQQPTRRSSNGMEPYTVIVRGATLAILLADPAARERLGALCLSADSVICCRVSPKQKGLLVKLVKDAGHLTLAIGDGGNDVAMIQEAAVGIGIRGKEGLQASRASDYSVPYFRALQRLLLIHGHYSYYRTCLVAHYSFYKSFFFCCMQILFAAWTGFAGVSAFNSLCVAAYNVVVFVPIVFFMTDRDITQATALALPEAYLLGSERTLMTSRSMAAWLLRGLWQAIATLLIAVYAVGGGGSGAARSADYQSFGLLLYFSWTWVQDLTMLLALRRVNLINIGAVFGMHALALAGMLALNAIGGPFQSFIDTGSLTSAVRDPVFWLAHALTIAVCVLPVEALRAWRVAFSRTFTGDLIAADARIEAFLGAHDAAGAGGAGRAWRGDVLGLGAGGAPLSTWVRSTATRAGGAAGGASSRAAGRHGSGTERPTKPLLGAITATGSRRDHVRQHGAGAAVLPQAQQLAGADEASHAAPTLRGRVGVVRKRVGSIKRLPGMPEATSSGSLSQPSYNAREVAPMDSKGRLHVAQAQAQAPAGAPKLSQLPPPLIGVEMLAESKVMA